MSNKPEPPAFVGQLDEIIKTAKALHTFPGYRKPKNLQYVTTLEETRAQLLAAFAAYVESCKPDRTRRGLSRCTVCGRLHYSTGVADFEQRLLEGMKD